MKIAIVGGTGTFGRALAWRLHQLGEEVYIGSREAQRAFDEHAGSRVLAVGAR